MNFWDIITCIYGEEKSETTKIKTIKSVDDCPSMVKSDNLLYDPSINYCGSCCHILEQDSLDNLKKYKLGGKLYYFCSDECHSHWLESPDATFIGHRLSFKEKVNNE
jgi:hypothetical protein